MEISYLDTQLPIGMHLTDLKLKIIDSVGNIYIDYELIDEIAEYNDLDPDIFKDRSFLYDCIDHWYKDHIKEHGELDSTLKEYAEFSARKYLSDILIAAKKDPDLHEYQKLIVEQPTADEIYDIRISLDITQKECAEICGLHSVQTWSKYETGIRKISIQTWSLFLLSVGLHPKYSINKNPD